MIYLPAGHYYSSVSCLLGIATDNLDFNTKNIKNISFSLKKFEVFHTSLGYYNGGNTHKIGIALMLF